MILCSNSSPAFTKPYKNDDEDDDKVMDVAFVTTNEVNKVIEI